MSGDDDQGFIGMRALALGQPFAGLHRLTPDVLRAPSPAIRVPAHPFEVDLVEARQASSGRGGASVPARSG